MDPAENAVAGNPEHQAEDEKIFMKAIKDLKLDDQNNYQKEHLDLCCGNGRLIRKVILSLSNKFKLCTGVDYSTNLINDFKRKL